MILHIMLDYLIMPTVLFNAARLHRAFFFFSFDFCIVIICAIYFLSHTLSFGFGLGLGFSLLQLLFYFMYTAFSQMVFLIICSHCFCSLKGCALWRNST